MARVQKDLRDRSLFKGRGGLVQIGGGSMIFMQGKRVVGGGGTLIYACILGSFVIQRGGEGQQKVCFTKGRVRRILTWPPSICTGPTPSKYDPP